MVNVFRPAKSLGNPASLHHNMVVGLMQSLPLYRETENIVHTVIFGFALRLINTTGNRIASV